ncbi:TorF family putative porin [Methyloversatilis thermotolerans]|uniref:TorF family putative porin n=1 Tax=Methyloversatilis thermotolerans TaxID=1346290 RepID=UPI000360C9EE|nr:TorF family putative porin [Methyloversatilis thermotolerans]
MKKNTALSMLAAGLLVLPAAHAAEPESDWTVPMSIGLVSDYIFRGQSQTWGGPALQFSIEAAHKSGFYAGFFVSNVSDEWLPGASVETDFYGGYRFTVAEKFNIDVGAIYYVYPGANWNDSSFAGTPSNRLDTAEAYIALNYEWLTFKTGRTLTEYFGWDTDNSPVNGGFAGDLTAGVTGNTRGSHYYELNASYDIAEGWNLSGQIGRQIVRNSTGLDITYYKVGVTKALPQGWSAGLFYSATNEPNAYKDFLSLGKSSGDSDIARDIVFANITKAF